MKWFKSFRKAKAAPPAGREYASTDMLGSFTPRAQQVLALAREEAVCFRHSFVGTEHLLLELIRLGQGVGFTVLAKMGIDLESVRVEVEKQVGMGPAQKAGGFIPYTPRVKKVLALAAKEARALNHTYVGTEHILLGLLREGDGVAARVLLNLGVDIETTRQEILKELDPNFKAPINNTAMPQNAESSEPQSGAIDTSKRYDVYCKERTQDVVVYRNALFKGRRSLFQKDKFDFLSEFLELEQSDGQTVFIARSSVIKFCEHGVTPGPDVVSGNKP